MLVKNFVAVFSLTLAIMGVCSPNADAQLCRAKFLNSYPYGGSITSIYAEFKHVDGRMSADGPNNVDITFGNAGYCYSGLNNLAVKSAYLACNYVVGGNSYPLSLESGDAPDGYHWELVTLEVAPAALAKIPTDGKTSPKERLSQIVTVYVTGPNGKRKKANFTVHEDWNALIKQRQAAAGGR